MHINYSKTNKYDYTPLQFAKSLFDKMVMENGIASESKVLAKSINNETNYLNNITDTIKCKVQNGVNSFNTPTVII